MTLFEIRQSGLLELYLLGHLDDTERLIVQKALFQFPELEDDLNDIERTLIEYTEQITNPPPPDLGPTILAVIDYQSRLENGEIPISLPVLSESTTLADYRQHLDRPDMIPPAQYEDLFFKIISQEPKKMTALVWLKKGSPDETHTDEFEKFLIVEGTCNITVGRKVYQLASGDYLSIPLYINHRVTVTSTIPCKIILQRVAA